MNMDWSREDLLISHYLADTCDLVDFPNETQKKKKSRVMSIVD